MNLFKTLRGVDEVLCLEEVKIEALSGHDYWTFVLSIPLHLKTTLETIPSETGYLTPPSARKLKPSKTSRRELRVGMVWKGSQRELNDQRSLPHLNKLRPLWTVPGVTFFSLQKGDGESEAAVPLSDQPLTELSSQIEDFADVAGFLAELDLLITVDTAIAHLAGAMGMPVWVMLQHYADWRWLMNREDSPWYPTMRLFRQPVFGVWEPVIDRIREALEKMARQRSSRASS